MKRIPLKLYIYISLTFLIILLIRSKTFQFPHVISWNHLLISFILLFIAFIFNALAWTFVLRNKGFSISSKSGTASLGLSIFGKYIPGKIWIILGRAEYVSQKYELPRSEIISLSVNTQFISLWTGLLIGTIGTLSLNAFGFYSVGIICLFVLLSLIIFTPSAHSLTGILFKRVFKRKLSVPRLATLQIIRILPWFCLNWLFWCMGFYFFAGSLTETPISLNLSLGFALAGSLGIMAVIMPGGLGVREGVLAGFLTLAGLDLNTATTISIASRIWFLVGEAFIFLVGFILHKMDETSKKAIK